MDSPHFISISLRDKDLRESNCDLDFLLTLSLNYEEEKKSFLVVGITDTCQYSVLFYLQVCVQ